MINPVAGYLESCIVYVQGSIQIVIYICAVYRYIYSSSASGIYSRPVNFILNWTAKVLQGLRSRLIHPGPCVISFNIT